MMTRRTTLFALVAAVCALPAAAAVDSALMALVPADANTLAGADLRQAKGSMFGQFLLNKLQSEEADFRELIEATGFDPRQDLDQVLVAAFGPGPGAARNQGLVLARGRFDTGKITAHIRAKGGSVTVEGGTTFIATDSKGSPSLIAFPESTLAVAGDADMVRAALARRPMSGFANITLANMAARWSGNDAWFVTTVPATQLPARIGGASPKVQTTALQAIEVVSGGVLLNGSVTIKAEAQAKTAQDATSLADVLRFVAGMVQMNRASDPHAEELAQILDKAQIGSNGRVVTLEFSVPETELERLFNEAKRGHGERRRATRKEASL